MFLSQKIDVRHVRIVRISDCVQGIEPCGGMGKGHIVVIPSAAACLSHHDICVASITSAARRSQNGR